MYSQLIPLCDAGWVDVWKRDRPDEVAWCHRRPGGGGKSQPDHLFVTAVVAPSAVFADYSMRELDAGLTDHAPMVAELII